jgi:lipopolysaccharide export system protein LptC
LVFAWPHLTEQDGRFRIGPVAISPEDAENFRMLNARYTGVDRRSRPYAITANSADQKSADARVVNLDKPKADILLSDQSWIALTAEDGIFDRESQILELTGAVNLFHDSGYEFHTTSAIFDLMAGDAIGQEQVSGQGPFGQLSAEGFRIHNQGERIELVGQAKIIVHPNRGADE